jgi:hypothetical protein
MDRLSRAFNDHPASVGESYLAHMRTAWWFAAEMIVGAAACVVHGVFPFLFTRTGSRQVSRLYDAMIAHRAGARQALSAKRDEEPGGAWCWTI